MPYNSFDENGSRTLALLYSPLVECSHCSHWKLSFHSQISNSELSTTVRRDVYTVLQFGNFDCGATISPRNFGPVVCKVNCRVLWPLLVALGQKILIRNFQPWCNQMPLLLGIRIWLHYGLWFWNGIFDPSATKMTQKTWLPEWYSHFLPDV